jgi:DNA-directed RNA polymerase specialized sigma24 family protein
MEGVIDTLDDTIDMEAAIDTLTERQRLMLLLWLAGHTHEEIARFAGVKRPAVTRQIARIVNTLSDLM